MYSRQNSRDTQEIPSSITQHHKLAFPKQRIVPGWNLVAQRPEKPVSESGAAKDICMLLAGSAESREDWVVDRAPLDESELVEGITGKREENPGQE